MFKGGITKPAHINPVKNHSWIRISGTKTVNRYMTITLISQESKPKVRILIGIKSIFKIGVTISISMLRTNPASTIVCQPGAIVSVGSIWLVSHSANTLNKNTRIRCFMLVNGSRTPVCGQFENNALLRKNR